MKKIVAMMLAAIAAISVTPAHAVGNVQNEITEESLGFYRETRDIGVESVGPNIQKQMRLRGDGSTLLASYTFEKYLNDGYYHEFGSFTGDKIKKRSVKVYSFCNTEGTGTKVKIGFGHWSTLEKAFVYDAYENIGLKAYKFISLDQDYPSYDTFQGCVTNNTGGKLRGEVAVYT